MLSEQTQYALRKAGWSEERRLEPEAIERLYLSMGIPCFPMVLEFLQQYGGLVIERRWTKARSTQFAFDFASLLPYMTPYWMSDLEEELVPPICPIGKVAEGYYTLMMDEAGRVYAHGDGVWFLGYTPDEALNLLCEGGDLFGELPYEVNKYPEVQSPPIEIEGQQVAVASAMPSEYQALLKLLPGCKITGMARYAYVEPTASEVKYNLLPEDLFEFSEGPILIDVDTGDSIGLHWYKSITSLYVWLERSSSLPFRARYPIEEAGRYHRIEITHPAYSSADLHRVVGSAIQETVVFRYPFAQENRFMMTAVQFTLDNGSYLTFAHDEAKRIENLGVLVTTIDYTLLKKSDGTPLFENSEALYRFALSP